MSTFLNGTPWHQQYAFNTTETAKLVDGDFSSGTALASSRYGASVVVTHGYVYLLGGYVSGSLSLSVKYAPIDSSGVVGGWADGTDLPVYLANAAVFVTKDRLYLTGGMGSSVPSNKTYTCVINSDGSLGAWSDASKNLLNALYRHCAVVTYNRVYLLGGMLSSLSNSTAYYADIDTDGIIGSWQSGTSHGTLKVDASVVNTGDYIYLIGGTSSPGSTFNTVVKYAPVDSYGVIGEWSTGTAMSTARAGATAIVTEGRTYLLGGRNGAGLVNSIISAAINTDGTLAAWEYDTFSTTNGWLYSAFVTSSRLYLVGGSLADGTGITAVRYADFGGGFNDYTSQIYEADPNIVNIALVNYLPEIALTVDSDHPDPQNVDIRIVPTLPKLELTSWGETAVFINIVSQPPKLQLVMGGDISIFPKLPEVYLFVSNPVITNIAIKSRLPSVAISAQPDNIISIAITQKKPILRMTTMEMNDITIKIAPKLPQVHITNDQENTITISIVPRKPAVKLTSIDTAENETIKYREDSQCWM